MERKRKFTLMFIAGCLAVAMAACIAIPMFMIRLIWWYMGHCGTGLACTAAHLTITYWWAAFIPASLLAAYWLRKIYDRRYALLDAED